jgi:hypothetical protein
LLQFINAKVQTFITVNDRSLIPSLPDTVYYDVQEGVVSKV